MNQTIIILISSFLLLLFLYYVTRSYLTKYYLFFKYKEILVLLELFLDKSYQMVYQGQLVAYMTQGYKDLPYQEKETAERDFVKQAFMLMGPTVRKIVTNFFGTEENLVNNMIIYFRKKLSDDGIASLVRQSNKES